MDSHSDCFPCDAGKILDLKISSASGFYSIHPTSALENCVFELSVGSVGSAGSDCQRTFGLLSSISFLSLVSPSFEVEICRTIFESREAFTNP